MSVVVADPPRPRSSGAQLYCTPQHVRSERILLAATRADTHTAALSAGTAKRFLDGLRAEGIELGVDQVAAVRGVLTSGARVETLVGPAETGKSFVVGTLARAWTDPTLRGAEASRAFGLATSQIATDVLAGEGLTACNVARWLATQDRLAAGPGSGRPQPTGDDEAWRLHPGDLVVIDESAMTDTPALAAVHRRVDAAGAKLLLVGDHRQLAAVGAGGGMDLLAQTGARYELADARRFTEDWERETSLRLRDGDETVLRDYHRHGRLLDSGTVEEAETSAATAWLGDTLAGQRSLLLVDTNSRPPACPRSCAPNSSGSAASPRPGCRSACRAPSPGSATSYRPAATPGTSPGTRATGADRSTARPTGSPPSVTTAGSRSRPSRTAASTRESGSCSRPATAHRPAHHTTSSPFISGVCCGPRTGQDVCVVDMSVTGESGHPWRRRSRSRGPGGVGWGVGGGEADQCDEHPGGDVAEGDSG